MHLTYHMQQLITQLIAEGYLKTPTIIAAFRRINRVDFLPAAIKNEADLNIPLAIGYSQTISQPLTVAFMLELLQPQAGNKVLDIGAGSGWQTALLAEIVGERGRVYAIERIRELKEFGENNVNKYNFVTSGRVKFFCQDGSQGLPDHAPFGKIIIAAAATRVPPALLKQLAVGGRLVAPIGPAGGQDIILMEKIGENKFTEKKFPGFIFVPLIED